VKGSPPRARTFLPRSFLTGQVCSAQKIQEAEAAGGLLDKPERWCVVMGSIPCVGIRLRCWRVKLFFDEMFGGFEPRLETILAACKVSALDSPACHVALCNGVIFNLVDCCWQEVTESRCLRSILGMILALGNYLNGGLQAAHGCPPACSPARHVAHPFVLRHGAQAMPTAVRLMGSSWTSSRRLPTSRTARASPPFSGTPRMLCARATQ